jgi:hypothetical protein
MSDVPWRDTAGDTAIWFTNGTQVSASSPGGQNLHRLDGSRPQRGLPILADGGRARGNAGRAADHSRLWGIILGYVVFA